MLPDWFIYALLGAIAAALASIFAKMGLQNVDSITATALRSIVMTIMVFAVLYFTRGYSGLTNLTQREYLFILLSGLAGGASWILYFIALQRGEAGRVAIVDRSSVLFVIVLATLILQEELTVRKIIAAILVFSALVLLAV
jgi:transporter family protein